MKALLLSIAAIFFLLHGAAARIGIGDEARVGNFRDFFGSAAADPADGAEAGILVTLSEMGISYVREVLVESVLQDLTPLNLPNVKRRVEWPIGIVDVELKNIVIVYANVSSSNVDLGNTGIWFNASGVETKVSLDWKYTYTASLIPFPISDSGTATAKVNDGDAWLQATMQQKNGTLSIQVTECNTDLSSLDLELQGGQSWLYQWFVYAFKGQIQKSVESALTTQVLAAVSRLNRLLLSLPRQLQVDTTSAVDVTVVDDPILNQNYISVGVMGEFVDIASPSERKHPPKKLPAGLLCIDSDVKMITVALGDYVITSASDVYYKAGRLERVVDRLPQQSLLNTASWRFLIPQLYRKFPNDDMLLNLSAASAPRVSFSRDGIRATTTADMTIEVVDNNEIIPVACISLEVTLHALAEIVGTNITGEASLLDLSLDLKWSTIGTFPVKFVEVATRTILKDVILPLVNYNLKKGFPLPVIPAIEFQEATIRYEDDFLLICTDIRYTGLPLPPPVAPSWSTI
ncbi:hypothetical protein SELMODRAFT_138877 [Selaginella moellendorffii]|uniref:Lipid-binding serum glycoprotein C-terminal domain-containing protein n=1 Tax=Selaginella moellendorffii TaxID=88036 RepID=D8TG90_SELML|nr:putative BPI/LBP family protein At1g04970 [Selaginella moellendorffii]EFJ04326.1 hypothetical protein SELMODRAFT_138877 [Selaginella moellendorffii]|eukprot:XP_002994608.1 putative BPI/LBP family protein At1g04970 [Selaginella moellendorffii]